jgi:hypothetical protein
VRRRHEGGQVVEPVVVDAPEDRPGHLPDGGEDDHPERLRPPQEREARQRGEQHDPGERAEEELLVERGEVVDGEQRREIRDAHDGVDQV